MSRDCIDCNKRYPGCHDKCEVYTKYSQEREKIRREKQNQFVYKDYISNRLWHEKRS